MTISLSNPPNSDCPSLEGGVSCVSFLKLKTGAKKFYLPTVPTHCLFKRKGAFHMRLYRVVTGCV